MRRLLLSLLTGILMIGLLTGCWDRREIEGRSFVFAMAIDNHPEGVEVSVQIPIPIMIVGSGGGDGGEGGQGAVHNFSAAGSTVSEALENLQNQTSQELFLGHTRLLLMSEEIAQKKGTEILDALRRHPQIRRQIWPLIVEGKAKDSLKINVRLAEIPTEYILNYVDNGSSSGRVTDTTLGHLFINQSDPTRSALINYLYVKPVKTEGQEDDAGGKVMWKGIVVMSGNRMVGKLSKDESIPILEIVEEKTGYPKRVNCPNEKGMFTFEPKAVDPSITVSHQGNRVKIRVKVEVWGGIVESTCSDLDMSKKEVLDKVEGWLEQVYEKQFRQTLNRAQKDFRTDVFQFGPLIRAYHPGLWNRIDWHREFPKADIQADYQVMVENLGLESR